MHSVVYIFRVLLYTIYMLLSINILLTSVIWLAFIHKTTSNLYYTYALIIIWINTNNYKMQLSWEFWDIFFWSLNKYKWPDWRSTCNGLSSGTPTEISRAIKAPSIRWIAWALNNLSVTSICIDNGHRGRDLSQTNKLLELRLQTQLFTNKWFSFFFSFLQLAENIYIRSRNKMDATFAFILPLLLFLENCI